MKKWQIIQLSPKQVLTTALLAANLVCLGLLLPEITPFNLTAYGAGSQCALPSSEAGQRASNGLVSAGTSITGFGNNYGVCIVGDGAVIKDFFLQQNSSYIKLKGTYYDQAKTVPGVITKIQTVEEAGHTQDSPEVKLNGNADESNLFNYTQDFLIDDDFQNGSKQPGIFFIDKNLIITNNITFTSPNIPTLAFIVGGDVYIDTDVTQIDAVIISSGKVYTASNTSAANKTCLKSSVATKSDGTTISQLVINGSLISIGPPNTVSLFLCRNLQFNDEPTEVIQSLPKYYVNLKDAFSLTLEVRQELN